MDFANNLKNLREANNVTQEQLAEYLKVSRPTIAGYETKDRQPDYERLQKIAEFFRVSIDFLVTGSEPTEKRTINEALLDQRVLATYRRLSPQSKQDTYDYIQLLELRDKFKNR